MLLTITPERSRPPDWACADVGLLLPFLEDSAVTAGTGALKTDSGAHRTIGAIDSSSPE